MHALYAQVRAVAVTDGPPAAHLLWQAERNELFAKHPASPLLPEAKGSFTGLRYAPYDGAFRFEVEVEPAQPEELDVPTGTDGIVPFRRVGRVALPGIGTLDLWRLASYGNGLFVPVKDGLRGRATYGAGRYLLDTVKGADLGSTADGRLIVDLNFAYNPSCVYDPAWVCPLAPPGNTVDVEVFAGELVPLKVTHE